MARINKKLLNQGYLFSILKYFIISLPKNIPKIENKLDNIEEMNRTMAEKINNISDNSVPMEKLNSLNHNLDVWCDKFNTLKKYKHI